MKKLVAVALFLGFVKVALAVDNPDPVRDQYDQFRWKRPQYFNQDLNTSFIDAGTVWASNVIIGSVNVTPLIGTFDYDFPAITAGDMKASTDKAFTLNGVSLGAPCFVGVLQATPADGGSAYVRDSIFVAVATAANTIELRDYAQGADAGVRNAPDAGYRVYCFN